MNDLGYWIAFTHIPGIGTAKFRMLEKHFGSLDRAWHANASALVSAGLEERIARSIEDKRMIIHPEKELEKLAKHSIRAINWHDDFYPKRLKEIYDPPPVLFVKGQLKNVDDWCVTVVGSRKCTAYGREVTDEIVTQLARNRITIVSGLARGIDTAAHSAALSAGGRTIAVQACGLDMVYPPENAQLAERIAENGAVISEYPVGVKPRAENFPRRNRIMSGLSLGVLVVEANISSGALITANQAIEQDRDVFAVPGSILSQASAGSNRLIQEGAKAVLSAKDILEELNLTAVTQQIEIQSVMPIDKTEQSLLSYLSAEPKHIDEVCRESGLSINKVSSTLAMMELKGMVKQVGAMHFIQARETRESYGSKAT